MSGMMIDWDKVERKTVIPGFVGRVAHSDTMTFVLWEIAADARLPEHNHIHEQVVNVLDGIMEVTVDGKAHQLTPGMVAAVPSNARHSGRAITDVKVLDVFYPIREDYRHGLTSTVISGKA